MEDDTNADDWMNAALVLRRTTAGQYEALMESPRWDGAARRLLLAVNGHTDLGTLLALFQDMRDSVASCVPELAAAGLIEPVDTEQTALLH